MNTLKKAALLTLGIVAFGFMLFSFATIGLTVLGIASVLVIVGFLARPFLPTSYKSQFSPQTAKDEFHSKAARKPCIIDVTATHTTAV